MKQTIHAVYENGALRFHDTIRLKRKLPLRNRTQLRFTVILPGHPVASTFGLLRAPKRLARLIAESPDFSPLNS